MDLDKMRNNVEVSDDHILLGKPLELLKYGKKLEIKQVNWFYDWESFSYHLAVFLMYYNQAIEVSTLPKSIDELKEMQDNIKSIIAKNGLVDKLSGGKAFKSLCELCKYTGASVRWMKKKFTIDDWIEVFMYVYLYNVVGKKKGLRTVFEAVGIHQLSLTQPKGKFSSTLKRRSA
jgi:hypothetical protein